MNNNIKKIIMVLIASGCIPIASAAANFSPYVDITLNAHWDSKTNAMQPADLTVVSQQSGIKSYRLAFITDAGNCTPAWGGQESYSATSGWGSALTDAMRASNISYVISFGGASGMDLSNSCQATQLVAAYEKIISAYQPQGLDFDIENSFVNLTTLMSALQQIELAHPTLKISFTLPILPEGLVDQGQNVIKQAQAAKLNYSVNIMAMDYGPSYKNDMGQYAIQAATSLFTFLQSLYPEKSAAAIWQMIMVTPMIGVNDTQSEEFTLADADTLRLFVQQNNLQGLSMWSVTRDSPCSSMYAQPTCSGNNLQTAPYQFAQHFLG